jgi:hypothetical protein
MIRVDWESTMLTSVRREWRLMSCEKTMIAPFPASWINCLVAPRRSPIQSRVQLEERQPSVELSLRCRRLEAQF